MLIFQNNQYIIGIYRYTMLYAKMCYNEQC